MEDKVSVDYSLLEEALMDYFRQNNVEGIVSSLPTERDKDLGGLVGFTFSAGGYSRVNGIRDLEKDYFGEGGWLRCPPASFRGHIVNAHFQARSLAAYGVTRWDIEACAFRDIELGWVVKKAYERLERTDEVIAREILEHATENKWDMEMLSTFTVRDYRTALVRNLKYIEQLRLATVDWSRVERAFPGASEIELDIDRDSKEVPFLKSGAYMLYRQRQKERSHAFAA